MSDKHTFSAVSSQLTVACNLAAFYILLLLENGTPDGIFPLVLLPYAPLIYGVNRLFLLRERTINALVALNVAVGGASVVALCLADGFPPLGQLLFIALFIGWLTVKAANFAMTAPTLNDMLLCLDGSILTLVIFTACTTLTDRDPIWIALVLCGFVSAILGVTARRSSRCFGFREWVFMAVAFGVIFAGMGLLMSVVAAPAGGGLVALWNGLVRIAALAGRLLTRFLQFLASLFSGEIPEGELAAVPDTTIIPETPSAEPNPIANLVIMVILVGGILFFISRLLHSLGRHRVGGQSAKSALPHQRIRVSFRQALRRLLKNWKKNLLLRQFLWKHRSTPVGLYFTLVRRCRTSPWHKLPGETPREFLTRLQQCARSDPQLAEAMTCLIPQVDAALYGGAPLRPMEQAALIRRRIGAAVGRQTVLDGAAHLRSGPHSARH